ncbi:HAD-IIIA family hydrolase [Desulfovibrio aminophilus]|uniref:D-glycero-alpha-D-manno-heptose-1,7-bisphosphate 7-phosphatase n=1 Tax=Desulfovibrio aminophilus TaxID=81425 RepID=UPI00339B2159
MERAPVVLLDRDGTIIVERHYLSDPAQVELLPHAAEGLLRLRRAGCKLAVITNQSGVGRGIFSLETLQRIHGRMLELLLAEGVEIEGIFFCPHTPEDRCDCRKPLPGLIEQAAEALGFRPSECFVIGDKPCDVELGQAVGARTILVRSGYGAAVESAGECSPDHVADDLAKAARIIEESLVAGGCPQS